jgi:hypothetical protein
MATVGRYLTLAELAYDRNDNPYSINGFVVRRREFATVLGDGFQGVVHEGPDEVIVAFSGTMGNLLTAPISQNTANLRIGVNIIPNMAGSAKALVKAAAETAKPVSIVGHSLGGALAQVVGVWMGIPFISFNGPGMKTHLCMSVINMIKPRQMRRTWKAPSLSQANGICFSVMGDFVGNFGLHVGTFVEVPWDGSRERRHDLEAIRSGLGESVTREPWWWANGFYSRPIAAATTPELSLDVGPSLGQSLQGFMI